MRERLASIRDTWPVTAGYQKSRLRENVRIWIERKPVAGEDDAHTEKSVFDGRENFVFRERE